MRLLTEAHSSSKTAKNEGRGYISALLYLAPSVVSGYEVCPSKSAGCVSACLYSAGRGKFSNVQLARINRTLLFFKNRSKFLLELDKDINQLRKRGKRLNMPVAVRLNGTSDLNWFPLIKRCTDIQFYDYTKDIKRLYNLKARQEMGQCLNYHLTFSRSESNQLDCLAALSLGFNVAVVFRNDLPRRYMGRPVVNGDAHDLRFLDFTHPKGLIIGLTAKGEAKHDQSGFVVD